MAAPGGQRCQYLATVGRGLDSFARGEIEAAAAAPPAEVGEVRDIHPLCGHAPALMAGGGAEGEVEGKLFFSTAVPIDGPPPPPHPPSPPPDTPRPARQGLRALATARDTRPRARTGTAIQQPVLRTAERLLALVSRGAPLPGAGVAEAAVAAKAAALAIPAARWEAARALWAAYGGGVGGGEASAGSFRLSCRCRGRVGRAASREVGAAFSTGVLAATGWVEAAGEWTAADRAGGVFEVGRARAPRRRRARGQLLGTCSRWAAVLTGVGLACRCRYTLTTSRWWWESR